MKWFLMNALLLFYITSKAQYPKYIIAFTDKNFTAFDLNNPSAYLSQRALDRRTRYSIKIDSSDLPVSQLYIDSVLKQGDIKFLSASKWLNEILIYTTDDAAISKIQVLPFVKMTKGIGFRIKQPENHKRWNEKVEPLQHRRNAKTTDNNVLDYGDAYTQVHIHNGEFLHNKGYTGNNMQIAVLDAGFNAYKQVTAFDSLRNNNQVLAIKDFVDYDNSVDGDDTHGRYCLSIMAANAPGKMTGTAPKASYYLLRTENASSEYPIEEFNWVVGAEYADSAGADLISSSLGYNTFDDASFDHSYNDFYKDATMISKGAATAVKKGMIVTNSAGNEGNNGWKYLLFPADNDSVCTVGAVDAQNNIASFSSYGYPGKVKPNIVSVGVNTVIAGITEPLSGNGTSFSNPNIAGLITCLWQAFPQYNNIQILDAVYKSADKYNNPDNRFGYGLPDMKKAYHILKHQQNVEQYGNDWLFVTPQIFTNQIDVSIIGQVDSNVSIELVNDKHQTIQSKTVTTETEEVSNVSFTNLDKLAPGNYIVRYTQGSEDTREVTVKKYPTLHNWLQASPNPFGNKLIVYIKAPETGVASVRLTDASGKTLAMNSLRVTQNEIYTLQFNTTGLIAKGFYFFQYISKQNKNTIKIVK